MTSMNSRPVTEQVVYPQDSKPVDERDGVLWVDTSTETRQLSVYSEQTAQWEPVKTDVPLLTTQEAVSFTETNVNLWRPGMVQNGALTLPNTAGKAGTTYSSTVSSNSNRGVIFHSVGKIAGGCKVTVDASFGGSRVQLRDGADNSIIASQTGVTGGDVVTFNESLNADKDYVVTADAAGASYTMVYSNDTALPYTDQDLVIDDGWADGNTGRNPHNIRYVELITPTAASTEVHFDSIPTDLSAWDIATWQYEYADGDVSVDIQYNDGSGWTTLTSDALPPVDISTVAETSDVRHIVRLTRPTAADAAPQVPYAARRGER